jgi:hypothetical protein
MIVMFVSFFVPFGAIDPVLIVMHFRGWRFAAFLPLLGETFQISAKRLPRRPIAVIAHRGASAPA